MSEETTYKGYAIKMKQDRDTCNPREEYDNAGTMVCFHKRYRLGDKDHDINDNDFGSWGALRHHLVKELHAVIVLPVYMYDHSGLRVSTTPFHCQWDSGQIGFIYMTREQVLHEWGATPTKVDQALAALDAPKARRLTKKALQCAEKYLIGEVSTYDMYLSGDVWCYDVVDPDGVEVDSLSGLYGGEYCLTEAKAFVDRHALKREKNAASQFQI